MGDPRGDRTPLSRWRAEFRKSPPCRWGNRGDVGAAREGGTSPRQSSMAAMRDWDAWVGSEVGGRWRRSGPPPVVSAVSLGSSPPTPRPSAVRPFREAARWEGRGQP